MKLNVNLDAQGYLPDSYGKFALEADHYLDHPIRSFPFEIIDAPEDTVSFALTFVDYDAIPVAGFAWIHWTACNIPATYTKIPDNFSQDADETVIQGTNSCSSRFLNIDFDPKLYYRYIGPQPPDQTHDYTLTVYALDCHLDLSEGFYMNELRKAMKGHILDQAVLDIPSRSH